MGGLGKAVGWELLGLVTGRDGNERAGCSFLLKFLFWNVWMEVFGL